ncbi:putative peptidoglycan lipid II flippase [Sediminihabitans luteus]|uniref:Putative peptidoglycan lipid II flippase n=1 Tax=Sediminihabitans luteus TaxID=1138585 RepID=A0A2M9CR89_9CELL|nr:lipid II flippase MurJ [Sediminihabitans luteus]PJJ74433.1 putative peptidoglycan lipid II flippase [Sediminihabitans luteus]GIJ00200.1 membrane protein [Sediminihabitans luteus]
MSRTARWGAAAGTLAGAAAMITAVNLASRLLGFLRSVTQASQVGPGVVGDTYLAANSLPNVLFEVAAGGALAGAVVPLLAGPVARRARVEASGIASALLTWALAVLVPLGVLVALLAGPITSLIPGVGTGESAELAAYFLRVFAVQIPLYGVGIVMTGVLQAHRRFFWPAAAPMFSSVVVIVAYLVYGSLSGGTDVPPDEVPQAALAWLAWGTTAGVAAMSLPLVVPAMRTGVRLRLTLRFPGGEGARARALAFAGIGALLAQQASVVAIIVAANGYGDAGTYSVFVYTQTVYFLPYAVLAIPLATSAFPRLSERAAAGDRPGYAHLLALTTRGLLTVTAAGVAALVAASVAVEAAFADFSAGSVDGMALGVATMAPGLVGFALIFHLSRALYAIDHGRAAVVATSIGWAVVAVLALALPAAAAELDPRYGTLVSLGVATSVGMGVAGVLLLLAVRRHAGPGSLDGLGRTVPVLVVATLLGAGLGWALDAWALPSSASLLVAVLVGLGAALVAAGVVLGASAFADRGALASILRPGAPAADGSVDGPR